MTIWHLKLFIAVAESGSMSAAAARYLIRQPSVSQKISELESHCGFLLFERFGNRLQITESGRQLLPMAKDLVSRFDFLEEYLTAERQTSRLRLGASVTVGSCVFPPIIEQYHRQNPDSQVFVCVNNTKVIAEKLLNNDLDLALVEGKVKSPDLIRIPELDDFLVLACGKNHPFFHREQICCHELDGMEFVMREPGSGTRDLFEQYLSTHGIHIKILYECAALDAIRSAVQTNNCLAVISVRLLKEDAAAGTVRLFKSENQEWNRTFDLVYHKNKHMSDPLLRFRALLEQYQELTDDETVCMGRLIDRGTEAAPDTTAADIR